MRENLNQVMEKYKAIKGKLQAVIDNSFLGRHRKLIGNIVYVIALGVFLFSVYKIVNNYLDYGRSEKIYNQMAELYKPSDTTAQTASDDTTSAPADTSTDTPAAPETTVKDTGHPPEDGQPIDHSKLPYEDVRLPREAFNQLLKVNKEIVGWIKIDNTKVDYPVVQTTDNEYYLTHSVNHKRIKNGTIFVDYRNNIENPDQNTIIYGHNMHDNSMFGDLLYYTEKWFYDKHKIIKFDTLYEDLRWEIFSIYHIEPTFDYLITRFQTPKDFTAYLNLVQSKSIYKTNIKLTENDKILTLSTCKKINGKDGRLVVQARLIQEPKDAPAASQTSKK